MAVDLCARRYGSVKLVLLLETVDWEWIVNYNGGLYASGSIVQ